MGKEVKFHPVSLSKTCSPIPKGVWGIEICSCSTKFFWGSGYGVMLMGERPYGDWKWTLTMVVSGVEGALMESMGNV